MEIGPIRTTLITVNYRNGQNAQTQANDENVTIFAPVWVENALNKLTDELFGTSINLGEEQKYFDTVYELTLKQLVLIARNESHNTTGSIKFNQYHDINKRTILALRDLAKHCVIVAKDTTTGYGGYPASTAIIPQISDVYICDLPGLQFQHPDNTGRHVLISENNNLVVGALDADIFYNTVGKHKVSYLQADAHPKRYLKGLFHGENVLFDTFAFQSFIKQDFVLSALALNTLAKNNGDEINFKFLKYGAGFFAEGLQGEAKNKLEENLVYGVLEGITHLADLPIEERSQIKRIELPYYEDTNNQHITSALAEIKKTCDLLAIEFASTKEDALKQTSDKYITATTNCSDPHAPTGNEMAILVLMPLLLRTYRAKVTNLILFVIT